MIDLPEDVKKPAYCKNGDDFNKLFYAMVVSIADDMEDIEAYVLGFRALLHDYMALNLTEKLKPYRISEEEIARNRQDFEDLINEINFRLIQEKVPMKEGKNGKLEIDYDFFGGSPNVRRNNGKA